ncbi:MAG: hypothetical protein ACRC80_36035, partial [Waterburya sp.]
DITAIPNFPQLVNQVNDNGFLDRNNHRLKMYRASELRKLLQSASCDIMAMSASNCLSNNRNQFLEQNLVTTDVWSDFLQWELDFCAEDGCLDSGTHIIAVVKKV